MSFLEISNIYISSLSSALGLFLSVPSSRDMVNFQVGFLLPEDPSNVEGVSSRDQISTVLLLTCKTSLS